jgi:Rv0078B-related antitoxin
MASLDTSTAAASFHEESYRQLGPAGRFKIAVELSDFTHALAVAGIRRRNPQLNDEEAQRRLAEVLYNRALHAKDD